MLNCQSFIKFLKQKNLSFFTGVPCSIFKDFLNALGTENKVDIINATSEGEACAIATGYHLASQKFPIVYMQNSGLGNSVNPLTSLLNKDTFSIPALLFISHRGKPGEHDEPEHIQMGEILKPLLRNLSIPFAVLSKNQKQAEKKIVAAITHLKSKNTPYAIIVERDTFSPFESAEKQEKTNLLTREQAIQTVCDQAQKGEIFISTTGKTSRELFEYRETKKQKHDQDFYVVGSMGCASGIALGLNFAQKNKKVIILDGDGAALMKMGTLASIGTRDLTNLTHIILDNSSYDSTGGQETIAPKIDFSKITKACGYKKVSNTQSKRGIMNFFKNTKKGPGLLVIKVAQGSRSDLGRPTITPLQNKKMFMSYLKK